MILNKKKALTFTLALSPVLACANDMLDIPVVLTGARLSQNTETALQPVSVITREMIELSGSRTVADVFRLIPGFTVGYKYGNQPTLITRGLTTEQNRHIQVRVDGRSIYLPATGGVFLQNLPVQLSDIERIEVSRGASSSVHGANALLAAIDIYTKSPQAEPKVHATVRAGSNDIEDYTVQFSETLNENVSFIGSVKQHRDDGLLNRNDARNDEAIWLKLDQAQDLNNQFEWQVGYSDSLYAAGGSSPTLDPARDLTQTRKYAQVNWTHTYNAEHDSNLILYYENFNYGHQLDSAAPGFGPFHIAYSYETERKAAEYYHNLVGDYGRFVLGGKLLSESYYSIGRISDDENNVVDNDVTQLFAQAEFDLSEHDKFNVGLMAEYSDIASEVDLSPQISYIHDINQIHYFRAGYSIAHRLPSGYENAGQTKYTLDLLPFDLYTFKATGYLNGGLSSEKIKETNVGYLFQYPRQDLRFEAIGYYSVVEKVIEHFQRPEPSQALTPFSVITDFRNKGEDVLLKGLEVNLDWKPTPEWLLYLSGSLSDINGNNLGSTNYPKSHPKEIFSSLVGYKINPKLTLSGFYHYVSDAQWSISESIDGYEKLDLQLSYCDALSHRGDQGCVKLVAQNVLEDVYDARQDAGWDQMYFVTLSYAY